MYMYMCNQYIVHRLYLYLAPIERPSICSIRHRNIYTYICIFRWFFGFSGVFVFVFINHLNGHQIKIKLKTFNELLFPSASAKVLHATCIHIYNKYICHNYINITTHTNIYTNICYGNLYSFFFWLAENQQEQCKYGNINYLPKY